MKPWTSRSPVGVSRPSLEALIDAHQAAGGDIDAFPVDTLVTIADRAGLAVELRIVPRAA